MLVNPAEERVGGYLVDIDWQYVDESASAISSLHNWEQCIVCQQYHRTIQSSEWARRPCAHNTCDALLKLPISYANYSEFHGKWMAILNGNDLCWVMNCL